MGQCEVNHSCRCCTSSDSLKAYIRACLFLAQKPQRLRFAMKSTFSTCAFIVSMSTQNPAVL
jgi:hypothetical protein